MKTIKYPLILIVSVLLSACLKEEDLNLPYLGFIPKYIDDGWEISSPEVENMDPEIINNLFMDFYNEKKYPTIRSLLLVRNGKLVAEAYNKDLADLNQLHNIMSATKSVTSILTGIALKRGIIDTIDTPIFSMLPQYFDNDLQKKGITLRHVLTMETGLDFNDDIHTS